MSYIFYGCKSLKSLPDISKWDTKNVIDMSYMFYCCSSLKLLPDISNWDFKNVNNTNKTRSGCEPIKNYPNFYLHFKRKISNNNSKLICNTNDKKLNKFGRKEEDYSYDCTNSMYLSVNIYKGTEEAQFEIFLKNSGDKTWAPDSKLINAPESAFITNVILLAQQKPNEERSYKITVKNLGKYPANEYKIIFLFYSGGKIHGEKISALVKIKEKGNKKREVEKYSDTIKEFRETFNLSLEEYPDDKILEILEENKFNFEIAFSSLFN